MTGDALLLGALKVKVSEIQSPMAPPVNEEKISMIANNPSTVKATHFGTSHLC